MQDQKGTDTERKRFGAWLLIEKLDAFFAICQCECGSFKKVRLNHLSSGASKSCGCVNGGIKKERPRHKKLDALYRAIKARCYNKSSTSYQFYGARGIKVCDKWKKSYGSFEFWAIQNGYQEGLQIDRIDVDGDYSPENCRWITPAQNSRNRRSTKLTEDKILEIKKSLISGRKTQKQISTEFEVSESTISLIKKGKIWRTRQANQRAERGRYGL